MSAEEVDLNEYGFAYARESLGAYAIAIHPRYQVYPHHRKLIHALERVERGECLRLMVLMPPRHGKSLTSTQIFPAWYLGKNPANNVIEASYGADLARDFGRFVRNALISEMHNAVFPDCQISPDSMAQSRFNTTDGGGLFAVGRGGALTGRGGNLIILDDLFKNRQEAENSKLRESVWTWYRSVVRTRLAPGGAIIIVNTRWHEDDLVGRLLAGRDDEHDDQWEVINIPAISEDGKALWPEAFPLEALLKTKHDIGTREFESLYQQNPTPAEGGLIKRGWLKFYKMPMENPTIWLQSWDMTFKDSKGSDYVVGEVWAARGARCQLIAQVRDRMDFPTTLKAVESLSAAYPQAHLKLVEEKANGAAVISMLKDKITGIVPVNPTESKMARLSAVSPMFEAGNVELPDPSIAPWVHDYVEEVVGFPNSKHDDQVDATSMALARIREHSGSMLEKLLIL